MNDMTYTYYINLIEATIRHEKLTLTSRESPSSSMVFQNWREL